MGTRQLKWMSAWHHSKILETFLSGKHWGILWWPLGTGSTSISSVQVSSVAQSCPTLCDPLICSTPGLPVHHQLLEFTQTHVHQVGDAIQPSHPLSIPVVSYNYNWYGYFHTDWRRLLRAPWIARKSNQSILKEINPEYSLEGLMLKLNLQYVGHLMGRADSLEKTLMLGRTEGKRRRGQQWMRWLDSITSSMDMSCSKLQEIVKDRDAWHATVYGLTKSQMWLNTWRTKWKHQVQSGTITWTSWYLTMWGYKTDDFMECSLKPHYFNNWHSHIKVYVGIMSLCK